MKKLPTECALEDSIQSRKAITFEDFARDIARRKALLGPDDMPRNSGTRRTDSKKALLAAIKATGKKW
jgi:hypothetical protein